MRAYLIDPTTKTVTVVDYSGDYRNIYEHIDCATFDVVRLTETDTVFVDDERLLRPVDERGPFFAIDGLDQPIGGKGLVLGTDPEEGESVEPKMSLEELTAMVSFPELTPEQIPRPGFTIFSF